MTAHLDGARNRVFIFGSGFSRAVSQEMPTVAELGPWFEELEASSDHGPHSGFARDPELLLSYLGLSQPWSEPAENLRNQARFAELQRQLACRIADCEAQAFAHSVPDWASRLVKEIHSRRIPVISLNYDTLIERLVYLSGCDQRREERIREFDLYDLPLSVLQHRVAAVLGGTEVPTFRLVKLHGSINWFYSGADGFPGEQVYYRAVDSLAPATDGYGRSREDASEVRRLCRDKVPLIIPPVAEKSRFYSNGTVRALWAAAREVLERAEEVICVGYSLPDTDLTMRLFLRAFAHPERVFIVNTSRAEPKKADRMLERYGEAFPKSDVDGRTFVCESAVEKMTEALLGEA